MARRQQAHEAAQARSEPASQPDQAQASQGAPSEKPEKQQYAAATTTQPQPEKLEQEQKPEPDIHALEEEKPPSEVETGVEKPKPIPQESASKTPEEEQPLYQPQQEQPPEQQEKKAEKHKSHAALWTGIATGVLGAVTVGLMARAKIKNNDYENYAKSTCSTGGCPPGSAARARGEQLANEVDKANHIADAFLGATAALGVTTLVLWIVNRSSSDESGEKQTASVGVSPLQGGAMVNASLKF